MPASAVHFLLVLDADSTLIRNEVIELIADEAGRGAEVARATEAAMRGEIDFTTSLRSRVAQLRGVPVTALERVLERVEPTPGAAELVDAAHERGGMVAVVSGGFHEILDRLAPGLGVDVWRANRLAVRDGHLTGDVDGTVIDAEEKARSLRDWARGYDLAERSTLAVGDGANDLRMMARAGLGIAFNAKPAVRAAADLVIGAVDLAEVIPLLP